MKRSEMIRLLQASFLFHMNPPVECCSGDEEMYSHVLKDLEDVGMLPPTRPDLVEYSEPYTMVGDSPLMGAIVEVNTWADESIEVDEPWQLPDLMQKWRLKNE